jgi:hypothetical protein
MRSYKLLFIFLSIFPLACARHYYETNNAYAIPTVNSNVCKKLREKVVLYAIFVDTRQAHPWTSYDIASTLDSISKATSWIMNKAKENDVDVSIDLKFHKRNDVIPIEQHLYDESLWKTLFSSGISGGIDYLDIWSNNIAKKAGESFPPDTSSVVKTKNIITNRERLIARLRDKYKTDNVVLMYFLNDYYKDDISLALHTGFSDKTEYAIVTFKYPAVIAHEFLHVFGALDLYISPFSRKKKTVRNSVQIMQAYPNEVMAYAYRPLEKLDISPLTKYLIGWNDSLADKDKNLLVGKKIKVYKY